MQRSDWDNDDQQLEGPAGRDWRQAIGALLLAIGLIGIGFIWGLDWGTIDLARAPILDQEP
jgi:hypothetical protein